MLFNFWIVQSIQWQGVYEFVVEYLTIILQLVLRNNIDLVSFWLMCSKVIDTIITLFDGLQTGTHVPLEMSNVDSLIVLCSDLTL